MQWPWQRSDLYLFSFFNLFFFFNFFFFFFFFFSILSYHRRFDFVRNNKRVTWEMPDQQALAQKMIFLIILVILLELIDLESMTHSCTIVAPYFKFI